MPPRLAKSFQHRRDCSDSGCLCPPMGRTCGCGLKGGCAISFLIKSIGFYRSWWPSDGVRIHGFYRSDWRSQKKGDAKVAFISIFVDRIESRMVPIPLPPTLAPTSELSIESSRGRKTWSGWLTRKFNFLGYSTNYSVSHQFVKKY